jgi:hypothetical protein
MIETIKETTMNDLTYESYGACEANPDELEFQGWGLVTDDIPDGVLVNGYLNVTGYNAADYWQGNYFKGADVWGIVPIYLNVQGQQFPADATAYHYRA